MKAIEQRLPQEFDKSFIVFRETGTFFPCPWHYHPEFELVLITSSTGRRMVGDHIGTFEQDDLVFMGPRLPHVWVNDEEYINGLAEQKAEGIVIQFVEGFLGDNFLSIPEMSNLKTIFELSHQGIVIKGQTRNKINALMREMSGFTGLQRLSALFTIFEHLSNMKDYELLASPGFVQSTRLSCSDRFKNVMEYVMKNFDGEITLPAVASVSNMAITTFCHFFKEHYRVTFIEYLNNVRIGFACKLLADSDKNVVEIAYESGYKSLANFNRQFRKFKCMTPSVYRKLVNSDAVMAV